MFKKIKYYSYVIVKFADSTEALCVDDIKVCAFNGGSDVWVDIGDKALGVESLQNTFVMTKQLIMFVQLVNRKVYILVINLLVWVLMILKPD